MVTTPPVAEAEKEVTGNRCGHHPKLPRFLIEKDPFEVAEGESFGDDGTGQKRRSRIQYKLIKKIQSYYKNTSVIPMLNGINGSTRQQRSERREACVALLEAMVHSMDLVSLRIGYPGQRGSDDFIYRTMEYLSEKAQISYSRAKRALKDLKSCGILSVKRKCVKNPDKTYTGLASTKCFSKAFMSLLGFNKWLSKERKKAGQRKVEKDIDDDRAERHSPKARAAAVMFTTMLIDGLTGGDMAQVDDDEPIPDPTI